MTDQKAPDLPDIPEDTAALAAAIDALVAGVADPSVTYSLETDSYGKCVEAMWRAAYIAHELVARRLHVTGFQHSISSLTVVGRLRGMTGPYTLVDASELLYPQYDPLGRTAAFLAEDDVRTWLADQAAEKLAAFEADPYYETTNEDGTTERIRSVHEGVEAHWRSLVATRPQITAAGA